VDKDGYVWIGGVFADRPAYLKFKKGWEVCDADRASVSDPPDSTRNRHFGTPGGHRGGFGAHEVYIADGT